MEPTHDRPPSLLPAPRACRTLPGAFRLSARTRVIADTLSAAAGRRLAEGLRRVTGLAVSFSESAVAPGADLADSISLRTDRALTELGSEGYKLTVMPGSVTVVAAASAGLYYALQTLRQLLPPQAFAAAGAGTTGAGTTRAGAAAGAASSGTTGWDMPCVEIEDVPRFGWRGFMLDTARHFFSPAEIERVLDLLAMHKLNVLHLHLTDDQAWRLQVPKHRLLTEKSAWRDSVGFGLDPASTKAYDAAGRYGGFFSRDDIRGLVAAAAHRDITLVPEIEMPGHATAALAAYPSLGCTGGPYSIEGSAGIHTDIFCAGKEETFSFLEDVLDEVFALFPGRFVHIGGDEAPKETWHQCPRCQARMKAEGLRDEHELQSWFIRRVCRFIESRGRRLLGWSEIREGGLARGAAVMDWIGGGLESARDGHDVVMTPTTACYFDYAQLRAPEKVPVFPNSYLPLSKVRALEPIPGGLEPGLHGHVLGTQGNLWTEYVPSIERVEYQAFPRMSALSEVAWSPAGAGTVDFEARLRTHLERMKMAGVSFCPEVE